MAGTCRTSARISRWTRIEAATRAAMEVQDRPSLIIVQSHIGFGSPHKQDTSAAHGSPLGEDEVRLTKEAYGWDPDKHFYVPEEALAHFRECCARGKEFESEWQQRFDGYRERNPELAAQLEMIAHGEMPDGWDEGPAALQHRRQADRDAQGVRGGDPVGRGGGPSARRRLGRPRDIDQHRHRRGSRRREGCLRRAQPALRRPRARDGGDRQRSLSPRLPRLRRRPSSRSRTTCAVPSGCRR